MPIFSPPVKRSASEHEKDDSDDEHGPSGETNHFDKRLKDDSDIFNDGADDDDEEDDDGEPEKKYDILNDDEIEGQEEGTTKMQEGVRITPFNVQEELEEGHFDTDGNYIEDKKEEIRDAWLEELDDYTDENYEKLMKKKADDEVKAEEEGPPPVVVSDLDNFKIILSVLEPGESVARALKRLGAAMKPVQKIKKGTEKPDTGKKVDSVKEDFEKLTSAADLLLQRGDLEIYEETFEKISLRISKEESKKSYEVNEEEDIFGETFVAKEVSHEKTTETVPGNAGENEDQTNWEFKWKNEDSEEIHGPYSSEQMNAWVQQDFFKNGVFVRKTGSADAQFYTSKRVDFELYM